MVKDRHIVKGNKLNCKPFIKAFVVGDKVKENMASKKTTEDYGGMIKRNSR